MVILNFIFNFSFYSDTVFFAIIVFANDQHQLTPESHGITLWISILTEEISISSSRLNSPSLGSSLLLTYRHFPRFHFL